VKRVVARLSALAALAVVTAAVGAQDAEEPLAAVGLHPTRVAFYEKAPWLVRASMRRAVEEECKTHGGKSATAPWLCSGRALAYFRDVAVTGWHGELGEVCNAQGLEAFKYYPTDTLNGKECLFLMYDSNRYSVGDAVPKYPRPEDEVEPPRNPLGEAPEGAKRVVYYERAPAFVKTSMRKTVKVICGRAPNSWLCSDQPLDFFRSVDVLGHASGSGYVCAVGELNSYHRYFPPDAFDNEMNCVSVR
jgi:hypothetical protein